MADPNCYYCSVAGQPKTGFCPEHLALLPTPIQDIWMLAVEARLHCTPYDSLPYRDVQIAIIRFFRPKPKPRPTLISLKDLGLS